MNSVDGCVCGSVLERQQITVGVHHVSATLSVTVWLVMVDICCPILLPSTSVVAFFTAKNEERETLYADQKIHDSLLFILHYSTRCAAVVFMKDRAIKEL